jgi:hypothetical protein
VINSLDALRLAPRDLLAYAGGAFAALGAPDGDAREVAGYLPDTDRFGIGACDKSRNRRLGVPPFPEVVQQVVSRGEEVGVLFCTIPVDTGVRYEH